ncbi:MAG: rRNA maturation RNAse YbeY [candidate division WOR-3 bacterium]
MKINFFWEGGEKKTPLLKGGEVRKMVRKVVRDLGIRGKELNIIFCSSPYIKDLARRYLQKDYEPACLTFPFREKGFLGEIYINYHSLPHFPIAHLLEHALKHFLRE